MHRSFMKINKLLPIFLLVGVISCGKIKEELQRYEEDNVMEEQIEDILEDVTGIDIDLSPFSKEEKVT